MATSTEEWIEELKGISVLELSERIKALEEEFGVSATAAVAAAPAAGGGGGDGAAAEEASSTVDVMLTGAGDKKIDRKSTRLNSSYANISYAVFCLKKKKTTNTNGYLVYL